MLKNVLMAFNIIFDGKLFVRNDVVLHLFFVYKYELRYYCCVICACNTEEFGGVMKIQYLSDLHLEFEENRQFLEENPIIPSGEVLVMCGDIIPICFWEKYWDFIRKVSDSFETVYWLPGNHECYYGQDIGRYADTFCEKLLSNVYFVNNIAIGNRDSRLIFSTLWSKIEEKNEDVVVKNLNDFRQIAFEEKFITAKFYHQMHTQCVEFLKREIAATPSFKRTAVFTHHVPTKICYPSERFCIDEMNQAYVTELSETILTDSKPDFWVFGHHHTPIVPFTIKSTNFRTNQLGYVDSQTLYKTFDRACCFEL